VALGRGADHLRANEIRRCDFCAEKRHCHSCPAAREVLQGVRALAGTGAFVQHKHWPSNLEARSRAPGRVGGGALERRGGLIVLDRARLRNRAVSVRAAHSEPGQFRSRTVGTDGVKLKRASVERRHGWVQGLPSGNWNSGNRGCDQVLHEFERQLLLPGKTDGKVGDTRPPLQHRRSGRSRAQSTTFQATVSVDRFFLQMDVRQLCL
jgi:hypothetical protein